MRKPRATKPLARKLRAIRLWKGMSQAETLTIVFPEADLNQRALVSQWENFNREPSRHTLIRYAQLAEISLEDLLIDEHKLPTAISKFAAVGNNKKAEKLRKGKSEKSISDKTEKASPNFNQSAQIGHQTDRETIEETISPPTKKSVGQFSNSGKDDEDFAKENISNSESREDERAEESQAADGSKEISGYRTQIFDLAHLLYKDQEPVEKALFQLPVATLDRISDTHLKLLQTMPRSSRPLLTLDAIVNLSVIVMLTNYDEAGEISLLYTQAQKIGNLHSNQCDCENGSKHSPHSD